MIRSLTLLTVVCALSVSYAQVPAPPQSYRNEALHFSFTYPAEYLNRVNPASMTAARSAAKDSGGPANITDCTDVPIAAIHPIDGLFDMVMLLQLDLACAKQPLNELNLADFTKGVAEKLLSHHGTAKVGPTRNFDLAGHQAVYIPETVDESAKAPGRVLNAVSICALIEKSAVCWAFMSYKPETLNTLIQLPVTFDGEPTRPLVPSNFFTPLAQPADSTAPRSH